MTDTTPEEEYVNGRSTMPTVADLILALMQHPKDSLVYPITFNPGDTTIALYVTEGFTQGASNEYLTDFPFAFPWAEIVAAGSAEPEA